ncbi:MAG: thioesterase II family protein [Pyrinomonadaceae bacterium]
MLSTKTASHWLAHHNPNPAAQLRLFCFPYAGGGAILFQHWSKSLPHTVEVCPVQLPGRGNRWHEPPFTSLLPLVREVALGLLPYLDKPFVFFGHSMGALISFELARLLRREGKPMPEHLFVSSNNAPQIGSTLPPIYDLPEPELMEELRRLNGTPKAAFEHPELMKLVLPLVSADFSVCQTHVYTDEPPLDCPISVFGGTLDPDVSREHLVQWQHQTTSAFSLQMFEGDHFYLHTARQQFLNTLSQELQLCTPMFV